MSRVKVFGAELDNISAVPVLLSSFYCGVDSESSVLCPLNTVLSKNKKRQLADVLTPAKRVQGIFKHAETLCVRFDLVTATRETPGILRDINGHKDERRIQIL